MFISALRVRSPDGASEGINTYLYRSERVEWDSTDPKAVLEQAAGELVRLFPEVRPGGNEVRTYLDLAIPDDSTPDEVRAAFERFWNAHRHTPVPWLEKTGRIALLYNSEIRLSPVGEIESRKLFERCNAALIASRPG